MLNLCTEWGWVIIFKLRPLYFPYPLYRKLGGHRYRSWQCEVEKTIFRYRKQIINPSNIRSLYRLSHHTKWKWRIKLNRQLNPTHYEVKFFGANSFLVPLAHICCRKFSLTPTLSMTCTAEELQPEVLLLIAFCSFLQFSQGGHRNKSMPFFSDNCHHK